MDFAIAGLAAVCAGFFTNPLEVIKTRLQLQGELKAKGDHNVLYRNIFHATYQITKHDGLLALQKGLVPALWIQLIMNGLRLGGFQSVSDRGYLTDPKSGQLKFHRVLFWSGSWGAIGHLAANPMFVVKTHRQSQATKAIAVGHQHLKLPLGQAFVYIYKRDGIKGLYRGGAATVPRAFVAASSQLLGFSYAKQWLRNFEYFQQRPFLTTVIGSFVGGTAISILVTPFDLVMTRLYNQAVNESGKGIYYKGYFDCIIKIYKIEGMWAFFNGIGPMYFRLGPHSILCLTFWDIFKNAQNNWSKKIS